MRRKIIAGNWKMYGTKSSIADLVTALKQQLTNIDDIEVVVFPPFVYLNQVATALRQTTIVWGAQNMSANPPGAYTGEIAAEMLLDFGVKYVLLGHSERRTLYHEDNVMVAMKFAQAKEHGLIPILCVGETLQQRQAEQTEQVISQQIDAVLALQDGVNNFNNAVIAYEPVWAIGTDMTATPEQAQQVHATIRAKIAALDSTIAQQLPLLYGGSVKANNAQQLFAMPDIDGGLIGGASLDALQFVEIVRCIN